MAPPVPEPTEMILPKGFVVNSEDIYKEIAKYPVLPPEKYRECWRIYTTTRRRLLDPTALRLENFWWRTWGSERRFLSGRVIAKVFEEISEKEPFVPLPGPPNRWEPPPKDSQRMPLPKGKTEDSKGEPSLDKAKAVAPTTPEPPVKALASSSTRPPPPHPILKKTRGDSKSGQRPTARFVSPHESTEEDERGGEGTSSSSTLGKSGMARGSPATSSKEKKKSSTPTKKFLASTATKRRPTLPRRSSLQSSSSEVVPKEGGPSAGSRYHAGHKSVAAIGEQADAAPSKGHQAKPTNKRMALRSPTTKTFPQQDAPIVSAAKPAAPTSDSLDKGKEPALREVAKQPTEDTKMPRTGKLPRVQSSDFAKKGPVIPPPMTRSQSHIDARRPRETSFGRPAPPGLLSGAATVMTTTDSAAGTIIGFDQPVLPGPPAGAPTVDEEDFELVQKPSTSSLLDSRFLPTQPSTAPTLPLGRTKSQLTLLLEKEKERKVGKSPSKN